MALTKRGKYYYGEFQEDIREEILRFSALNDYVAEYFANVVCSCGKKVFGVTIDDNEGVAVRTCIACNLVHPMCDSEEYLDDAELELCACPCKNETFEITIGVSLYLNSEDVRWIYVGCRCDACGLTAVYGHWKNEYLGYKDLLAKA